MSSLDYTTLESNKRFKLNFDGGDLSSDAGLLLIKEFISKLHFDRLIGSIFHTNDFSNRRTHKDDTNLLQVMCCRFSEGGHQIKIIRSNGSDPDFIMLSNELDKLFLEIAGIKVCLSHAYFTRRRSILRRPVFIPFCAGAAPAW